MVEFALVAPLFLALLLGSVEIGTALNASNTMSDAIRGAGRLASMDWDGVVPDGTTPNQKIINDIRNFLKASGLPSQSFTIKIKSAEGTDKGQDFDLALPANRLRLFTIEVSVPYSAVRSYPSKFLSGKTLKSSVTFRAGRVQFSG